MRDTLKGVLIGAILGSLLLFVAAGLYMAGSGVHRLVGLQWLLVIVVAISGLGLAALDLFWGSESRKGKLFMRELTRHQVNGCNEALKIEVLDEPGGGGASHLYKITGFDSGTNASEPWKAAHGQPAVHSHVLFQNGPIPEVGTNGVTHEALLAILIDRLEGFQKGPFAHPYNADALASLRSALASLQQRTKDRLARGVEGTHTV